MKRIVWILAISFYSPTFVDSSADHHDFNPHTYAYPCNSSDELDHTSHQLQPDKINHEEYHAASPFHTICIHINARGFENLPDFQPYFQYEFTGSQVIIYTPDEFLDESFCNTQDCCQPASATVFVPTQSDFGQFLEAHGHEIVTPRMIYDIYYCKRYGSCNIVHCQELDGYTTYTDIRQEGGICNQIDRIFDCQRLCTEDANCIGFGFHSFNADPIRHGLCCLFTSHSLDFSFEYGACLYESVGVHAPALDGTSAPVPAPVQIDDSPEIVGTYVPALVQAVGPALVPAPSQAPFEVPDPLQVPLAGVTVDGYHTPTVNWEIVALQPFTEYFLLHSQIWICRDPTAFHIEDVVYVDIVETSGFPCPIIGSLEIDDETQMLHCPEEECVDGVCPFGTICSVKCQNEDECFLNQCAPEVICQKTWGYLNSTDEKLVCATEIECGSPHAVKPPLHTNINDILWSFFIVYPQSVKFETCAFFTGFRVFLEGNVMEEVCYWKHTSGQGLCTEFYCDLDVGHYMLLIEDFQKSIYVDQNLITLHCTSCTETENIADWVDYLGNDCSFYEDNKACRSVFVEQLSVIGLSAVHACCYCGGGVSVGQGCDPAIWPVDDSWKDIISEAGLSLNVALLSQCFGEWYYQGMPTCVGNSGISPYCIDDVKCGDDGLAESDSMQMIRVQEAINNGGIHSGCRRGKILDCPQTWHTLFCPRDDCYEGKCPLETCSFRCQDGSTCVSEDCETEIPCIVRYEGVPGDWDLSNSTAESLHCAKEIVCNEYFRARYFRHFLFTMEYKSTVKFACDEGLCSEFQLF